ncbi:MAG: exodeoxyribonuclease III [Thermodesulfovibrionales bacterium]|nr:exodeoxyribonuclease III [Thermodesulfovibrionales bacterium]
MKVASFNVNSIRARLKIILEWLKKESPDVLCLQETKIADKDFPQKAFEDIHYYSVFCGEKSYNGVAILSKRPIENIRIGFDEYKSEGTRIITATIDKIPTVNTYVPQGFYPLSEEFREKLDWLERLCYYFKEYFSPDKPLIWVGDFNVAPGPIDVYDPEFLLGQVGFHPDEHTHLQRIKDWGFVDVFRLHHPEPEQYTFWDYRIKNAVNRKMGWRIDHIWATKPLAKKCNKVWIDIAPRLAEKPSDHTFIVAEFKNRRE